MERFFKRFAKFICVFRPLLLSSNRNCLRAIESCRYTHICMCSMFIYPKKQFYSAYKLKCNVNSLVRSFLLACSLSFVYRKCTIKWLKLLHSVVVSIRRQSQQVDANTNPFAVFLFVLRLLCQIKKGSFPNQRKREYIETYFIFLWFFFFIFACFSCSCLFLL